MNILAKFHQERTIFDEIKRYLLILLFYLALTRASEGMFQKKAIKFEFGRRNAKFSQNMSDVMTLKVKKFGAPMAKFFF